MVSKNLLLMAATEADAAAKGKKTIEAKLETAMKVMVNYWAFTDDDLRFQSAVAGALMSASDEDKQRVKEEMDALRCLSSAMSGFGSITSLKPPEKPVGIMKIWIKVIGVNQVDTLGSDMVATGKKIQAMTPEQKAEMSKHSNAVCRATHEMKKVSNKIESVKK